MNERTPIDLAGFYQEAPALDPVPLDGARRGE
jgi:hypothetical protein